MTTLRIDRARYIARQIAIAAFEFIGLGVIIAAGIAFWVVTP